MYTVPPSALVVGVENNPPKGNPASPGIAKGLVDKAFNSRTAKIHG